MGIYCLRCLRAITVNAPIVSASSLIAHSVHTAGILIDEIYVAASERKKGLARAMIKHVIQTNPQAKHVYLIVRNMRAQQKAAVQLYKDIGMKYVPRSDHVPNIESSGLWTITLS